MYLALNVFNAAKNLYNKVAEKLDEIVFSAKKFVQEISVIDYRAAP